MTKKKDTRFANISFVCGLLCWVPAFNLILNPLAIIFGIMALVSINKHPKVYGGTARAIIGISLSAIFGVLTAFAIYTRGWTEIFGA